MLGILRPRLVALRNSSKLHTVSLGFVQIGIYICVVLILQEDRFYSERGLGAATSNKAFEMMSFNSIFPVICDLLRLS